MITEKRIEVAAQPVRSRGWTVEVHGQFRDRRRLHYPCFHTDARFDDGMSGGPVFDQSGALCGLVSIGYDLAPEAARDPISYAALLWPALATELCLSPFEGHHVSDLAARGTLQVEGSKDGSDSPSVRAAISSSTPPASSRTETHHSNLGLGLGEVLPGLGRALGEKFKGHATATTLSIAAFC